MTLVKAKMSFYHDKVGTRALDEMFEVKNETLVGELEQAGYVQRVEGEAQTAHEDAKNLQQQVGQANALANEAVSLASHEHNQKTLQDQQNFAQVRQQTSHYAVEQEITRLQQAGDTLKAQQLQQTIDEAKQQQSQQARTQMSQAHAHEEIAQAEQAGMNEASMKAKKASK